jgi:hypothetical protein
MENQHSTQLNEDTPLGSTSMQRDSRLRTQRIDQLIRHIILLILTTASGQMF